MFQFPLPSFLEGVAWPHPALRWGWGVAGLSVGPGAAPSSTRAPSLPPEGRLLQSACFFLGAC